jgi:hypothetical protein
MLSAVAIYAGCRAYRYLRHIPNIGPVDKEIVSEIERSCVLGRPCELRLRDVVKDFDWDTMYVFEMGASRAEIESVIHAPLNHNPDLVKALIFMKQGRITHYEEETEDIENATDRDLNFNIQQSGGYKQFSNYVLFSVSIEKLDKAVVYELTAVP